MKATVIIPARYASTRLAAKPLADLCGRPMIVHVMAQAKKASLAERVVVATDDERIFRAVEEFGGEAVMTSGEHPSGTDRVAEAADRYPAKVIVNLQGDLPVLPPEALDQLIGRFCELQNGTSRPVMGTLKKEILFPQELYNPNIVKVVADQEGFALYFSRSPIPYVRDVKMAGRHYKHYGVYIYQKDFLKAFTRLQPTPLEQMEKLEQLRALEHGYKILVVETSQETIEVDTTEDLEKVRKLLKDVKR